LRRFALRENYSDDGPCGTDGEVLIPSPFDHIIRYTHFLKVLAVPPRGKAGVPVFSSRQNLLLALLPGGASLGAKQILLIDGDADSRAVYRIMLEHRGYDVHEAETAQDGYTAAVTLRPSVIVMELTLKSEDGYSLVERLRANPLTCESCIVIATARALRHDEDRAAALGCSLFLLKPVEPKLLVTEIDRLTGWK
jgi:two-component system, cell cycle response regulator DivK